MAGPDLIGEYVDRLARHLPADAVAELADGLAETYDRQRATGPWRVLRATLPRAGGAACRESVGTTGRKATSLIGLL